MILVRRAVVILVGLVLLAAAILYGGTEMQFRRHVAADLPTISAATHPADIVEGARLAKIAGCTNCHGSRGEGRAMIDDPMIGRIIAPALSRTAANASDDQLARAIRNGVGIDARPLYVMPTEALNRLSDDDLARLIGWIRSLPTTTDDLVGRKRVGPMGRLGVLIGRFPSSVNLAGGQPRRRPADIGRYFVEVSCSECHLVDTPREANEDGLIAPALAPVVAGYDPVALKTLLRTGKATGDRALPMMSEASLTGLHALSDAEIDAIQAWLRTQLGKPAAR